MALVCMGGALNISVCVKSRPLCPVLTASSPSCSPASLDLVPDLNFSIFRILHHTVMVKKRKHTIFSSFYTSGHNTRSTHDTLRCVTIYLIKMKSNCRSLTTYVDLMMTQIMTYCKTLKLKDTYCLPPNRGACKSTFHLRRGSPVTVVYLR